MYVLYDEALSIECGRISYHYGLKIFLTALNNCSSDISETRMNCYNCD